MLLCDALDSGSLGAPVLRVVSGRKEVHLHCWSQVFHVVGGNFSGVGDKLGPSSGSRRCCTQDHRIKICMKDTFQSSLLILLLYQ